MKIIITNVEEAMYVENIARRVIKDLSWNLAQYQSEQPSDYASDIEKIYEMVKSLQEFYEEYKPKLRDENNERN